MLTLTLTPNRADQQRYYRFVRYERRGNVVTPVLVTRNQVTTLRYSQIAPCATDDEIVAAWKEHYKTADHGESVADHNARIWRQHVRQQRQLAGGGAM